MSASNETPTGDLGLESLAALVGHLYEVEPALPAPPQRKSLQVAKEKVVSALRRTTSISISSLGLDR